LRWGVELGKREEKNEEERSKPGAFPFYSHIFTERVYSMRGERTGFAIGKIYSSMICIA
jgi:hypothetical protein